MSNLTVDEKIGIYKRAYEVVYGELPVITKNGSWLKINDSMSNFRAKDLPEMAANLLHNYNMSTNWNTHKKRHKPWEVIDSNLIKMFLDKIYEKCGNSIFEMENFIKNSTLSDVFFTDDNDKMKDILKDYWELKEKLKLLEKNKHNLKIILEDKKDEIIRLKNDIDSGIINYNSLKKQSIKRIKELEKYIHELKTNSVIFSMDDLGTPRPINEKEYFEANEDDIPF